MYFIARGFSLWKVFAMGSFYCCLVAKGSLRRGRLSLLKNHGGILAAEGFCHSKSNATNIRQTKVCCL